MKSKDIFLCLSSSRSILIHASKLSLIFLSYISILSCHLLLSTAAEHKHQVCANIIFKSSLWFKFQRSRPTHIMFIIRVKKNLCWSDKCLIHTQLLVRRLFCYVDLNSLLYILPQIWYILTKISDTIFSLFSFEPYIPVR